MSLTNPKNVVTEERLSEFYGEILPYLGGSADAGFTPVGSVIAIMGVTAPANYLMCDGTVYNIADYPELANYFNQQFGSKNKFGGNGTTTFAVPDLRGEFLRGTGTNSHTNQGNGSSVGTHQDATEHWANYISNANKFLAVKGIPGSDNAWQENKKDSTITLSGTKEVRTPTGTSQDVSSTSYYTARPTNTSVLYCIATKNIYLNPSNDYSTDEKVVGTWIDGKPLYQKTLTGKMPKVITAGTYVIESPAHGIANIDKVCTVNGYIYDINNICRPLAYLTNNGYQIKCSVGKAALQLVSAILDFSEADYVIIVQYTKTTD